MAASATETKALRTQLATLAKKHPATVVMLDLASAQIAGATMAEISSVFTGPFCNGPDTRKIKSLRIFSSC